MEELFTANDAYRITELVVIGSVVALSVVSVCISAPFVVRFWYKARRAEMELSLKQSMIDRGMTAQQICAVIYAGDGRRVERERPCPPATPNDWKEWAHEWKDWAHRWKARRARV